MHVVCVVLQWWTKGPVDGIAVRGGDRSEGVRDMQTSTGGVSPPAPAPARLLASTDETRRGQSFSHTSGQWDGSKEPGLPADSLSPRRSSAMFGCALVDLKDHPLRTRRGPRGFL